MLDLWQIIVVNPSPIILFHELVKYKICEIILIILYQKYNKKFVSQKNPIICLFDLFSRFIKNKTFFLI